MGIETQEIKNESIESLFDFEKFIGAPVENKTERKTETKSTENTNEKNSESIFENHVDTGENKTAEEATEELKKGFENLNPLMVIGMFDMFMSRTFAVITKLAGYDCSYKDYSLDEKEKKFLVPFVESVVMDWLKTLKPRDVLIVAVCIMYGSKGFEVVTSRPRNRGKKKSTVSTSVNTDINTDVDTEIKRGRGRPRKY